jgi:hypothetical protein
MTPVRPARRSVEQSRQRDRRGGANRHAEEHQEARALVRERPAKGRDEPERDGDDGEPKTGGQRLIVVAADERERHGEEHSVEHPIGDEHADASRREGGGPEETEVDERRRRTGFAPDEAAEQERRGDGACDERG